MPEEGKSEKKDVEMKDAGKDGEKTEAKKEEKKEKPKEPKQLLLEAIALNLRTIHAATAAGDSRMMGRVVRSFANLRRTLTTEVLVALLEEFVDASRPFKATFIQYASVGVDVVMEDVTPAEPAKEGEPVEEKKKIETKFPTFQKPYPPEFEAYALLLVLLRLTDKKEMAKAKDAATAVVTWLKTFNRRTLDFFITRAYFYMSLAYERSGELDQIRAELLAAYRTACLQHNTMGQATLLNLVLRNYLAYNLYEQALKFVQKTNFPESRPNSQYARYLFYIGQIKAVQLEYSDSHSKLMQAIRKAPQSSAGLGFKLSAYKLAIIVELLTGGVPDRTTFLQKELRVQLRPYYAITQAVRSGDLKAFKEVIERHEALFKKDKTLTLINRLRYNVIKTGLRSINLSYSRISLKDISAKLGLETAQDAAGVVAKCIVDGVIDATIDYDNQYVSSQQKHDLYSTSEPQKAFHKRIAFCLQMHNDTVKAMAYPDESDNKDSEDPELRREREKEQLANIDDDGDDDDMML
jgi:26S proteasome regulatory subunit N3